MATPATPQWSTGTKMRSRPMFRTVDTASACSGMRVMPTERKIAASKL